MALRRRVQGLAAAGQAPPGSRLIITSPAPGSSVSGAVYFAVQLANPGDLSSLELLVGSEVVRHQFPGETPLRVFLIPRDHPEGPLQLSARVGTGNGRVQSQITVQVVHAPPSSASVGAGGAILGGVEESGAISTVSIPAGTAQGASVQFQTMTQDEVLSATGVNYDALGVTFLGAQEIRSTIPTGDNVAMTSGGFGPMVQPGQMVVSYRIIPDAGRGVGELMVINGAAVAPNGDIVSNPPVVTQVTELTSTSALGSLQASALYQASSTLPAGPPGTTLEFRVNGLNIYAVHGYQLRFRRGAQTIDLPATVGLGGDGRQYLMGYVPELSPGTVTVELVAVAGDHVFGSYTMNVTASPAVADPKGLVDAAKAQLIDILAAAQSDFQALGMTLDFAPLIAATAEARAYWATRPADDPELVSLARLLAGGGVTTSSLSRVSAAAAPSQLSVLCEMNGNKRTLDRDFTERTLRSGRYLSSMKALQAQIQMDYLDGFGDRFDQLDYDCDPLDDEELCEDCDDDSPNDPLPQPPLDPPRDPDGGPGGGPRDWVTGMGSLPPPGGPLGGSAGGGGPGGSSLSSDGRWSPPQQAMSFPLERGRFLVRGLHLGNPWPFATEIRPDGYFYLPAMPVNSPMQLVVTDRQTFAECVVDVQGRSVTSATAVYIDLPSCLEGSLDPDDYTIVWAAAAPTGNWATASNWDPPRVPNEDDDVLIPSQVNDVSLPAGAVNVRSLHSNGTVRVNGTELSATGDIQLNSLRITGSASTIDAGGELSYRHLQLGRSYTLPAKVTTLEVLQLDSVGHLYVNHVLEISQSLGIGHGGVLRGTGRTILLPGAAGTYSGSVGTSGGGALLDAHTLEVRGSFEGVTAGVGFHMGGTSTLHVAAGGTVRFGSANYANLEGASPNGLVNHGLVVASSPRVNVNACLHNHGTVEIEAGSLLYLTSSACGASHNYGLITGEGVLELEHGIVGYLPYQHHADAVIDVDRLQLTAVGAGVTLHGALRARELEFTRGNFTIDQDIDVERLILYQAPAGFALVLNSSGIITASEFMSIGSSTLSGPGSTALLEGGELQMLPAFTRTLSSGHTLVNHGTATWGPMGTTQITINADAAFHNHGAFIVQNDRPVAGAGVFRNFGVLHKTAEGVSTWSVCTVQESGGSYLPDPGTIDFTGVCPP